MDAANSDRLKNAQTTILTTITTVSSSYEKRIRRWRQQIKDVNDELDFITPDRVYDLDSMSAERLAGLRERLRLICEEMDENA